MNHGDRRAAPLGMSGLRSAPVVLNAIRICRESSAAAPRSCRCQRVNAADDPGGSVVELEAACPGELHELPDTVPIGRDGTQPDCQVLERAAIAAVGEERTGLRVC